MLALAAALVFLLALIGVHIGNVDMIALGLFLLSLHFALGAVTVARGHLHVRGGGT